MQYKEYAKRRNLWNFLGRVPATLRIELPPLLLISAVVVFSFAPVLFLGYIFFDEEQVGFYYPQSFFYWQALNEGGSLAWNNYYYGGVPVVFDQFVNAFYPLHWFLFSAFYFLSAHHLSILIAALSGCFGAYWFGRLTKMNRSASVILALGYFLATTFAWFNIGTLAAHAFLVQPFLLVSIYNIDRMAASLKKMLYVLVGALALGIGFLAGFAQIVFYFGVIAFLFALFLDIERKDGQGIWRRTLCTRYFLLIVLLGLAVGARQILPSAIFVRQSIRTAQYALQNVSSQGVEQFITFLFPEYVHLPFLSTGSAGFYIGAFSFFMVLAGIFFLRDKIFLFFFGAYVVVLGFAFHLPIFSWINEHIPPLSNFGGQFRWMSAGAFPLAYLGARGYQGIISGEITQAARKIFGRLGAAAAVFVVGISLVGAYGLRLLQSDLALQEKIVSLYFSGKEMNYPQQHYLDVLSVGIGRAAEIISPVNWRFIAPLAFFVAAFFLIKYFLAGKLTRQVFILGALLLSTLNTITVFAAEFHTLVPAEVMLKEPAIVQAIKAQEDNPNTYRIAGFLIGDVLFWDVLSRKNFSSQELAIMERELLVNNSNVFYDIQRIDGMEPYRSLRHNQLLNTVIFPEELFVFDSASSALLNSKLNKLTNYDVLKEVNREEKVKDFIEKLPLLSALNVKYIYSLIPLSSEKLEEIPLDIKEKLPFTIYLYENKDYLPRVYLAKEVLFEKGSSAPGEILLKMLETKNYTGRAVVECGICALPNSRGKHKLKIVRYERGRVELEVESEKGVWLIFGESNTAGWTAQIDGIDAPIYPANYIFQGVYVPDGIHKVDFIYKDILAYKWLKLKKLIGF